MLCQKKKKEQNGLHVKTTTYVTNFHYRMMTLIYLHTSVQEKNYTTPFLRKRIIFAKISYQIKQYNIILLTKKLILLRRH